MEHPAELNSEVELAVNGDLLIAATVVSYELNAVDGNYHYHLQAQMNDGNNAATVQVGDVIQGLVKLKDERE